MAIEIPETLRRPGASFFHASSRSRSSRAWIRRSRPRDVQNTLVVNALMRFGNDDIKRRYLSKLAVTRSARTPFSEAFSGTTPSRSRRGRREDGDSYAIPAASSGSRTATKRTCSRLATINPEAGYPASPRSSSERGFAGFTVGTEGRQLGIRASSTCELIFDECRVPSEPSPASSAMVQVAIETLNEGRIGSVRR